MVDPSAYQKQADTMGDWRRQRIGKVYALYNKKLWDANALDFDDIILHTVRLLQSSPETLAYYQHRFRYVLIDEYQDTNHLQYLLAHLLAGEYENICVVGDDDQSIYRFRGANIENILGFEKDYRHARTIRLEQNYRSTQHILDAANAVIRNNRGRKGKTLWTDNGAGELVTVKTCFNESDEANYIVGQIMMSYNRGASWRDHAVLYRMNAQSNALEYAFKRNGVPYKIFGGMKYFDRAEVKDMLAYLCVINNPADDLRLRRIINVPARKIGQTSVDKAQLIAAEEGISLFEVVKNAGSYPELKSAAVKMESFAALIAQLQAELDNSDLVGYYEKVCEKTGYTAMLKEKDDLESRGRLENVEELSSSIHAFLDNDPEDPTLAGFLDEVALYTDLDDAAAGDNCVVMMTVHSAKGLAGALPGCRCSGRSRRPGYSRRSSGAPDGARASPATPYTPPVSRLKTGRACWEWCGRRASAAGHWSW